MILSIYRKPAGNLPGWFLEVSGHWWTTRYQGRVSKGRDVPLSLCPRTKKFSCPAVPLSRDKKSFLVMLSLCPGTREAAKIPGQDGLSRDVQQDKMAFFCPLMTFQKKENMIFILKIALMGKIKPPLEPTLELLMQDWLFRLGPQPISHQCNAYREQHCHPI